MYIHVHGICVCLTSLHPGKDGDDGDDNAKEQRGGDEELVQGAAVQLKETQKKSSSQVHTTRSVVQNSYHPPVYIHVYVYTTEKEQRGLSETYLSEEDIQQD